MRLTLLLAIALGAAAQSFEVASIRPAPPYPLGTGANVSTQGGPGTTDPTHIVRNWSSLRNLIDLAYGVQAFQVSGPGYLDSDLFNISATVPEGATRSQVQQMWRNLLIERFGLAVRVEKKVFDGREVVIAKSGARLKPTTLIEPDVAPAEGNGAALFQDVMSGGGLRSAGMMTLTRAGSPPTATVYGRAQTAAQIAGLVRGEFDEPAVDRTGLTGKYDFEFNYNPRPRLRGAATAQLDTGIDLVTALEENLGLAVRKAKVELDYIVVEKINRQPTEN